jgi:hypothetical protein
MVIKNLIPSITNAEKLAPVAVYTYTRVDHFIETIESLKKNHLAAYTTLYIVSDGPKCNEHKKAIEDIRNYVEDLSGFREVVKIFRPTNLGLTVSPPNAEQQILYDHGKIINMEDDNITSRNFLDFINFGLNFFEKDDSIYSICGYCPPVIPKNQKITEDFWRYPWNLSWGYGIWKEKYKRFYPLKNNYPILKKSGILSKQNRAGGLYVSDSLWRDYSNLKYFPDAVIATEMFAAGMFAIVPTISKIINTGQDGSGQSSKRITKDKYLVTLDTGENREFDFSCESRLSGGYRVGADKFYNGGLLTRWARLTKVYHRLLEWRDILDGAR